MCPFIRWRSRFAKDFHSRHLSAKCNYLQATLGTTSHFEGIILSMTGVTFQTGATMNGKVLAQTAVVLDGNTVTQ
jgi:hypothetical protein